MITHATAGAPAPVVWVQAGHEAPREPGYAIQTGAGSGPFGDEIGFTTRLATALTARLRAAGVDARRTPGKVTPLGAPGAVFISLHHDTAGGHGGVGGARSGSGENWYHGEGTGSPSRTPYPDSAPHRRATRVSLAVERRSHALAVRLSARMLAVRTAANGAHGPWTGVEPRGGNQRMVNYYGFYRTTATARVLVECGDPARDAAFLRHVDLISRAIGGAILDDLRARGLLRR